MKKTYMAPTAQAITFDAMTMLAASPELKVNSDKEVDASTSFSGEKDDPLVIFSHRHGREHYSLHSYQITHSLCFLTVFLFRFPSYRNQSS